MSIFMESSLQLKFSAPAAHNSPEADAGIIEVRSYAPSVNASVRNVCMTCGSIQRDLNFRFLPVNAPGAESEILLDLQYHRVPPRQQQKFGCSSPVNDLAIDGDHPKTETSFRIDAYARHDRLLSAWFFGAVIHLHR